MLREQCSWLVHMPILQTVPLLSSRVILLLFVMSGWSVILTLPINLSPITEFVNGVWFLLNNQLNDWSITLCLSQTIQSSNSMLPKRSKYLHIFFTRSFNAGLSPTRGLIDDFKNTIRPSRTVILSGSEPIRAMQAAKISSVEIERKWIKNWDKKYSVFSSSWVKSMIRKIDKDNTKFWTKSIVKLLLIRSVKGYWKREWQDLLASVYCNPEYSWRCLDRIIEE